MTRVFEVSRETFVTGRIESTATSTVNDGDILLSIESVALTANNVTYAIFGDQIGYWRFFPGSDPAKGRVPAWGFATVSVSQHPQIRVGSRWYGFLPIATQLTVRPKHVSDDAFMAADGHRRDLPAAYNRYRAATSANGFDADNDVINMVFRPLFLTGYLIAETLDNQVAGASAIVSSASSKTAIAVAADIRRRGNRRCVGLTSAGNQSFVESLGIYDRVVAYDAIDSLNAEPTAFVDIAGHAGTRNAVHDRFANNLLASLAVGASHGAIPASAPSAGPAPQLFFAPAVYDERVAAIGSQAFEQAFGAAWLAFAQQAASWLEPRITDALEAVPALWDRLVAGDIPANQALIVRPQ
ncbi:MAG: DUF2855 family protein [Pseudomonadota bacterium]